MKPKAKTNFKQMLDLNPYETQEGKLGRPFRLSQIGKKTNQSKWINRVEKFEWIAEFKYLDDQGGTFKIEIDFYDKIKKL